MRNNSFKFIIVLAAVGLLLFQVSCGGGDGGILDIIFDGDDTPTKIAGYVTEEAAGSPVQSAMVTVLNMDGSIAFGPASTDSNGYFEFNTYPAEGVFYNISVEKTGYGRVKVYKYTNGAPTNLPIVLSPIFDPGLSLGAPDITIQGIQFDENLSGTANITLDVTTVSPVRQTNVYLGNMAARETPDFSISNQNNLNFQVSSSNLPPNFNTYIYISTYDMNNNRTYVYIPVTTGGTDSSPAIDAPGNIINRMVTFGAPDRSMKEKARKEKTPIERKFVLTHRDGEFIFKSTVVDTYIFGYVEWNQVPNADGYVVYRERLDSFGQEVRGIITGNNNTEFFDEDNGLTPGKSYAYSVAPYTSEGIGEQGSTIYAEVLPRFQVTLQNPSSNADNVSTSPNFTWQINNNVGSTSYYTILVQDMTDNNYIINEELNDQTSYQANGLSKNSLYFWNLQNCMALGSLDITNLTYNSQSFTNPYLSSNNGG
ncbi:MAG: carboxypeptidase-like regulatory domain-containing protein, partial [Vulcanimicrobiota bacterium]